MEEGITIQEGQSIKNEALAYHREPQPGKLETAAIKPCSTADELSLAYSPGVAEPVMEIHKNPLEAYHYTNKSNLVAVISNGTAILGLGNLGALASKPVMEGKGVLFKRFADVDVYDLEINTEDTDEIIRTIKLLEPSFGGINLEDFAAPACFQIEKELKNSMDIPVFHDDQHGTAIISTAGLINAAYLRGRALSDLKVVFNGAGAAGISCARMFVAAGVKRDNIVMCDRKGVIRRDRGDNLDIRKKEFATTKNLDTLEDALKNADVFIGLSIGNILTDEMLLSMKEEPIVFAMANPDPEIPYDRAKSLIPNIIMATGRSDYPNQINNVLGFPYIFRGALDVRAWSISDEMKMAASKALAEIAREEVPASVAEAYNGRKFSFGTEYIVPTPFDPRVFTRVSFAVAKAAAECGVAREIPSDWEEYRRSLDIRYKKIEKRYARG
jgi:malate dehydrogenase (oxaloacetate-decarboxylating)(NADP+)